MTSFSRQAETPPVHSTWDRWRRRRRNLDNQDLAEAAERQDVEGLRRLLERPDRDLEYPYRVGKAVNHFSEVWCTPLEDLVDKGAPVEAICLLIQAGNRITPLTLELALDGACSDCIPSYREEEFEHGRRIFDALTEADADWDPVFTAYAERHPNLQALSSLEARRRARVATAHEETVASKPRRSRLRS